MSRNRMKNSQSLHWMGVVKWVLVAGLLSLLGLSYMFCKTQNLNLADETRKLQQKLDAIEKRNSELTLDLGTAKSPRELERRLAQNNSTLVRLPDSRLAMLRFDQHPTMRTAPIGTEPNHSYNAIESYPVTSTR